MQPTTILEFVELADEMQERCPDATIRVLSVPSRIMFRWDQQLSNNVSVSWDRIIKNRFQWLLLRDEMDRLDNKKKKGAPTNAEA